MDIKLGPEQEFRIAILKTAREILSELESINEKLEESNKLAHAQKSELEEIRQELIRQS